MLPPLFVCTQQQRASRSTPTASPRGGDAAPAFAIELQRDWVARWKRLPQRLVEQLIEFLSLALRFA
jgi:hypothetical protein